MREAKGVLSQRRDNEVASSGWDTNQLALPKPELRGLIEIDFMRIERTLPYVSFVLFR